jgi:uncharacterized protein (TIGR03435 family)
MPARSAVTFLIAICLSIAWGQPQDRSLKFDVASVKRAAPLADGRRIIIQPPSGGPGTKDPTRIHYPNISLRQLLTNAYDVKPFQISGPAWLDTERFDIDGTMPPGTTKEQFRIMLQNLLADRFKAAIHRETKELPIYSLEVARSGSKLKPSADVPLAANPDDPISLPSQPKIGADGFPEIPPQPRGRNPVMFIGMPTRVKLLGQDATMEDLTDRLTFQLNRPVTDKTGLKGKFDFTLTFSTESMPGPAGPGMPSGLPAAAVPVAPPSGPPPEGESLPDLFTAVQSQLGLKLDAKKGPVVLIVIDRIEKNPTDN